MKPVPIYRSLLLAAPLLVVVLVLAAMGLITRRTRAQAPDTPTELISSGP